MNKVQAFRLLFFAVFSLFFLGCSGGTYSIVPGEGVSVPGITALAFNNGGDSFVSLDENGSIRIWDVYSGSSRLLEEGGELQDFPFEAAIGGEVGLSSAASSGIRQEFPVFSPDGAKKLFPAKDGSIILADAVSGNELARYYGFGSVDEWVSLVPEAYYNASFLGSSYLAIETRNRRLKLGQLSGFLFRPDLFYASMLGGGSFNQKAMMPAFLMDLLNKNQAPPEVSLSMEKGNLKIKVIEQKGGTGHVALFRRSAGREIPFGLFDAEEKAASKYPERGKTCYEIIVEPGFLTGEIGVSAFNKTNTVESETTWIALPGLTAISLEQSPSFLALLVSESEEDINALEGILSLQNGGELYSTAEIVKYFGSDFSKDSFLKALENLRPGGESRLSGSPAGYGMGSGNTILFYLGGRGYAGPNGDLLIVPWNAAGEISGDDILKALSGFFPNVVLLLDLEPALPLIKTESAVFRFRQKLGPGIMLVSLSSPDQKGLFARSIREGFDPAAQGALPDRFLSGAEFQKRLGLSLLKHGINFIQGFAPPDDFPLADLFYKTGELKFQTMTSGMLRIDRVDTSPVPLNFGGTLSRRLPPGSYIIDMTYRNGYKETRFVNLAINDSTWVIFNYTPALLTGNYSGAIPSMGINIAELNPANYDKINKEAMEGMGMAPYYVAYLSGEKFYREEKYDEAISEYGRAISLKADYADAFVSRGNAQRKKGNFDRAIEDYTRALALNRAYAEVYNYRGFVYAQKSDYSRAIADYTQAVRYKAGYGDAFFNRAFAYGKQGKWDEAIADYTQVIRLEPSNAFAYNGRGTAWQNKGDIAKAEADYEAAARLDIKTN